MQHPLELSAARFFPAEAFPDHRSHRYRSFMIEEILTEPPDAKGAAPAGELLKFGVQALLSARPYHNHLGTCRGRRAGRSGAFGSRAPRRKHSGIVPAKLSAGSAGRASPARGLKATGAAPDRGEEGSRCR